MNDLYGCEIIVKRLFKINFDIFHRVIEFERACAIYCTLL